MRWILKKNGTNKMVKMWIKTIKKMMLRMMKSRKFFKKREKKKAL